MNLTFVIYYLKEEKEEEKRKREKNEDIWVHNTEIYSRGALPYKILSDDI